MYRNEYLTLSLIQYSKDVQQLFSVCRARHPRHDLPQYSSINHNLSAGKTRSYVAYYEDIAVTHLSYKTAPV